MAEDIVQDTYVEAVIQRITDVRRLTELCCQIATERRKEENKNISKPRFGNDTTDTRDLNHRIFNNLSEIDVEEVSLHERVADLGKGFGRKKYICYETARAFCRGLGIRTKTEWDSAFEKDRIPNNIPKRPDSSYKNEWKGWKDFLGGEWLPFDEARAFVIASLVPKGITSSVSYIELGRAGMLPKNIPLGPDTVYLECWQGWGHWFGKANARSPRRDILSFEDARNYVLSYLVPLGIDTLDKYNKYVDPPQCLPNDLHHYYKDRGWRGSGHFFETEKKQIGIKKQCSDYKTVREWCRLNLRTYGISGKRVFKAYLQGRYESAPPWPTHFPKNPENYFTRRNQWVSYSDLFGVNTSRRKSGQMWPYEKARAWVLQHLCHIQIITKKNWKAYVNEKLPLFQLPEFPLKMPIDPEGYYRIRKQWQGWPYFVGRSSETGMALVRFVRLKADNVKKTKMQIRIAETNKVTLSNRGIEIQGQSIFLTTDKPLTGKRLVRLLAKQKPLQTSALKKQI